jgi:hypothetical protein
MASTITCDPDGDLRLEVGAQSHPGEQLDFVVCSKTLSRASRPFKKMLYGNFRESMKATTTSSEWVVELPEDDPAGMKVLLHIIHSNWEEVPTVVSLDLLNRVLDVADKYEMTHLTKPWANTWFQPLAKDVDEREYNVMLKVAWNIGADHVFKKIVKSMCLECDVSLLGEFCGLRGGTQVLLRTQFLKDIGALSRSIHFYSLRGRVVKTS